MPRPKSYTRTEAIEKACHAFWQHGYQALGVRELERLTGLNQFAIRSEFGGKEGLYLEALAFYSEAAITQAMAPLKTGGLEAITGFLQGLVTEGSLTSSAFGCLIVNTGIENTRVQSDRLEKAVQTYWTTLDSHFLQALTTARAQGQLPPGPDLPTLANALVTAVMGIHASNRTHNSHTAGKPLADLTCQQLQSLGPHT